MEKLSQNKVRSYSIFFPYNAMYKASSVSLHDVRSGARRSFIHCVIWKEDAIATYLVLAQFFETDIQETVVKCSCTYLSTSLKLLLAPDLTSCKDTEVTLRLNISKIQSNIII